MSRSGPSVALVTGASSGIGEAFARALSARGDHVALVARRDERLHALAAELPGPVTVLAADLARPEAVEDLVRRLAEHDLGVDLLVNNAGLGQTGPFADASAARAGEIVDVNVRAATLLTRAVLPPMLERGRGAIVNVVSMSAFQPVPYLSVYAASKAYLLSFSEAVGDEVRGRGVVVQALCPGLVKTEFQARAGTDRVLFDRAPATSPEAVVRASLRGLERGRARVFPARTDGVVVAAQRVLPRGLVRRVARELFRPR